MTYRLLTVFLWPLLLLYTLKISFRDKSLRYFLQRMGFSYPQQKNTHIWLHCASVGEVNTLMPLLQKILKQYPQKQFVISTNTTTGAQTIERHHLERTQHCYLPIESAFAIRRFLKAWKIQHCLIMETEIWPLLYSSTHKHNVNITLLNARLSHRTLNAPSWIKQQYLESLKKVNKILCKSAQELNNFKTLGATDKQLFVCGNLKLTTTESKPRNIQTINLNNRHYCLAASTHNNEEQQLAELWQKLNTDKLLVIVPRHPNRSEQIQKQLNILNVEYAVRSKQQNVNQNTQIYLADTLGELTHFMLDAELIFMGGSLIPHGGQNLLEAARLGKAIVCGPHMFNFKDEVELLLEHRGCIQVENLSALETSLSTLLNQPEQCNLMGKNALSALTQQTRILDKYLEQIPPL